MPNCVVCMETFEESAGLVCGSCNHFVCDEDLDRWTRESSAEQDIQALLARRGRICCPQAGCGVAYPQTAVARRVSEEALTAFFAAKQRVLEQGAFENAQQMVQRMLSRIHLDGQQGVRATATATYPAAAGGTAAATAAAAAESINEAMLVEQLRRLLPDPRQCGRCGFGPVDPFACADLAAHDGQQVRNPLTNRTSGISNRCPREACNWFAPRLEAWPPWDGRLHPEFTAQAAAPPERVLDWFAAAADQAPSGPAPMVNLPVGTIFGAAYLLEPTNVAVDREGLVVVSDKSLCQVIVFNRDGSILRRFGSQGPSLSVRLRHVQLPPLLAEGLFGCPMGVAVNRRGRIVVADNGKHQIHVMSADGSVVRSLGSQGSALGQLRFPIGVAIDREDRIVVADSGNCRIQVLNEDGSVARHFGSRGVEVGRLVRPHGVAVDGAGRIVVADAGNHRVQVFNGDGSVALCFGSVPGHLHRGGPEGVAVDREGRFVTTDSGGRRIQVFNADGSVARMIGTTKGIRVQSRGVNCPSLVVEVAASGAAAGQLNGPVGVAVDGAGRILVAEVRNRRVQIL